MILGEKVIFFGGEDWWYHNKSSSMRLLLVMAMHGNDCLYINPISMRMPKIGRSGSGRRYRNKLKSSLRYFKKSDERIWVLSPFFIPDNNRRTVQALNSVLVRSQLKLCLKWLGWHKQEPIIFAAIPTAALVLPGFRRKVLVYYLSDKYDKYRDIASQRSISELDNKIVRQADILVTVSKALYNHYISKHKNCYYVPHGVDFDLFNKSIGEHSAIPLDLRNIGHPIIGYFGSITESNDKKILAYMAENRPRWNIVLIGEVVSDYSGLEKFPNIHFLGKKKLQELPNYGKHFDVCIMNWIMNEWMHYCNPIKAKEYLAMGKPVVSVPIPEVVETMGDVVAIATSPSEFLEKVEWELVNDCPERREARIQKVSSETWESRMEEISRLVEFFLKGK